MLMPSRLAIALQDDGWILRNDIIWAKPNPMPSSVKDRRNNTYEHIFHFVQSKKYWYDLDAVREKHAEISKERVKYGLKHRHPDGKGIGIPPVNTLVMGDRFCNPLGKNPGDVMEITTQPFPEAHFAVYPERLVVPLIKSGCPKWVCVKCGTARERIVEKGDIIEKRSPEKGMLAELKKDKFIGNSGLRDGFELRQIKTTGWTKCSCGAGFTGGTVLDPFAGSGTTSLAALKLGRNSIGIELSPEYVELIKKRLEPHIGQTMLTGEKNSITVL